MDITQLGQGPNEMVIHTEMLLPGEDLNEVQLLQLKEDMIVEDVLEMCKTITSG